MTTGSRPLVIALKWPLVLVAVLAWIVLVPVIDLLADAGRKLTRIVELTFRREAHTPARSNASATSDPVGR